VRSIARAAAAAVMAVAAIASAETQIKPWTARATPSLALQDLDGRRVELSNLRGRVVILNFWATWCIPCRDELPSLQRLRKKMAGKPVEVLTVNYGEMAERVKPFLQKEGLDLPVLLDTQKDAGRDWSVGGLPMTFVLDASGHARYSAFGELDWSAGEPLERVEKLVAEAARARR
jgi:thiol-disulfide isomerase/thioredoxin